MKIGQVLKNTLHELSQQSWQFLSLRSGIRGVEVAVNPECSHAIQILMRAGLSKLETEYNLSVHLDHNIYLKFLSHQANDDESEPDVSILFKKLEVAINNVIKELALNWKSSQKKITSSYYKPEFNTFENQVFIDADILLRILAKQYDLYPKQVFIPDERQTNTAYISGDKDSITRLIDLIKNDLPTINCIPEAEKPKPIPTLTKLCLNKISRQFLFYQQQFNHLPHELIVRSKAAAMEATTNVEELEKYKHKIIIFKTNSNNIHCQSGFEYLIETGIPLNVGFITERNWLHDELGKVFKLHTLMKADLFSNNELNNANLKFGNLKIRLPLPQELDQIKQGIIEKKGQFFDTLKTEQILEQIEKQKSEMNVAISRTQPINIHGVKVEDEVHAIKNFKR